MESKWKVSGWRLGVERDGFRNSLDWIGAGRYTLDARLFAGEVYLR